jgi:hypothetical protein
MNENNEISNIEVCFLLSDFLFLIRSFLFKIRIRYMVR